MNELSYGVNQLFETMISPTKCPFILVLAIGAVSMFGMGCVSTRQVETSTPRVFNTPEASDANAAGMSILSVEFSTGETDLPAEVQALRFRVDEIRLRNDEGEWSTYPSELSNIEVLPGRAHRKTLLATRVLPLVYDSIAVQISDVFVLFGENAGGALTLSRDGLSTQEIHAKVEVGTPKQLQIVFETGASLTKDQKCRWHFVPFWIVNEN